MERQRFTEELLNIKWDTGEEEESSKMNSDEESDISEGQQKDDFPLEEEV